jgi:hypothetical protein
MKKDFGPSRIEPFEKMPLLKLKILMLCVITQIAIVGCTLYFEESFEAVLVCSTLVTALPLLLAWLQFKSLKMLLIPLVPFIAMHLIEFNAKGIAIKIWPYTFVGNRLASDIDLVLTLLWEGIAINVFTASYLLGVLVAGNKSTKSTVEDKRQFKILFRLYGLIGIVSTGVFVAIGQVFAFMSPLLYGGPVIQKGPLFSSIEQLLVTCMSIGFIAIGLYIFLADRQRVTLFDKAIFYGIMIEYGVFSMMTGTKLWPLYLIIALLFPRLYLKSWSIKRSIFVTLLILIAIYILFSYTLHYRSLMLSTDLSLKEPSRFFAVTVTNVLIALVKSFSDPLFQDTVTNISSRFVGVDNTAIIISLYGTKETNPPWSIFLVPFFALVPRAFFPSKPTGLLGSEFSIDMGSVRYDAAGWAGGASTYVLGSAIYDGGVWGLVAVYSMLGILFSTIYSKAAISKSSLSKFVWTFILFMNSITTHGSYQSIFNNIIRLGLFTLLTMFFIRRFANREPRHKLTIMLPK